MNNPNVRSSDETQKQFNERRRSTQSADKARGYMYFWYSAKGTYIKPTTVIPQFVNSNTRKPRPVNKFKGFRKVRKFFASGNHANHPNQGMSRWVPA
jgi:hypothetical protein